MVNVEHLKPFSGLLANEGKNIVKIIEKLRSGIRTLTQNV